MTAIARELDEKMRALDPASAAALEKLVREALDRIETRNGGSGSGRSLPVDFFARLATQFGPEPFERPPQGDTEPRQDW